MVRLSSAWCTLACTFQPGASMQLARVVLAAGLLLAACLVYLQLLGPEPQPEKELRLARMGFRERCAGGHRLR